MNNDNKDDQMERFMNEAAIKAGMGAPAVDAPIIEGGAFPVDAFPQVWVNYARSLSATYGVPEPLFLMLMLGTISGAAGPSFALSGGVAGQWTRPNLFLLFGLGTGSHKSVANRIMKPIQEAEDKRRREWEECALPKIKAELKHLETKQKKLNEEAGPEERADLAQDIATLERKAKHNPDLVLGSVTTVALAQQLQYMDHETAFMFSPEAGDMLRVALGLYRDKGMDADLLLSGYTGEGYKQTRAGSGHLSIQSPCLTLTALVQPLVVRELVESREARERGLLGRFLILPLDNPKQTDPGGRPEVDVEAEEAWNTSVWRVLDIRFKRGKERIETRCTLEAQEVFRLEHNESVNWCNGAFQDSDTALVRYREQMLKVGLCLHIAQSGAGGELSEQTARSASNIVRWAMAQFMELTHQSRSEALSERLQKLMELVPEGGHVTLRDLKRTGFEEAELKQLCSLPSSGLVFSVYKHPGGAPLSPRVSRQAAEG